MTDALWALQNDLLVSQARLSLISQRLLEPRKALPVDTTSVAEPKKYKWATSLDVKFKFNIVTASPHRDLANIDWKHSILGVDRSSAGSEGVFFVDSKDGAFVVKGSRCLAAEVYAALLGLRVGIYAPRMRIINTSSDEGVTMLNRLKELDSTGHVVSCLFDQAHILLKEFLPGKSLGELGHEGADEILGEEGAMINRGIERLQSIGGLMVADVLLNNCDRLPLIWDNGGNGGNVMLCGAEHWVVNVDSQTVAISQTLHKAQFEQYLQRVADLMANVNAVTDNVKEVKEFAVVRSTLAQMLHYDISRVGTKAMTDGFVETLQFLKQKPLTLEELATWVAAIKSYGDKVVGLQTVDPEFVLAVQSTLFQAML